MSPDERDRLSWPALIDAELRVGPRLDPVQNRPCPACGLGPTHAVRVDVAAWMACETCGFFWNLGTNVFTGKDWQDPQDEGEMFAAMVFLSQFTNAQEFTAQGDDSTMIPQPQPDTRPYDPKRDDYDPWPTASPDQAAQETSGEPPMWYWLNPPSRARLWGITAFINATPAERRRGIAERVREELMRQRDAGNVVAARLFEDIRLQWTRNNNLIGDVVARIDAAGSALAFLTRQRQLIDERIARLKVVAGQRTETEARR